MLKYKIGGIICICLAVLIIGFYAYTDFFRVIYCINISQENLLNPPTDIYSYIQRKIISERMCQNYSNLGDYIFGAGILYLGIYILEKSKTKPS